MSKNSEQGIRRRIQILDRLHQYEEALFLTYLWRNQHGNFASPSPLSVRCQEWAIQHGEKARDQYDRALMVVCGVEE